ncbi:hypothetical protein EZV73_19645 [Acidaminobacter sp. JC074]|uniref:type II toxin-antitoxin system RnlB family antitoxin n=1 Tax=Acidaminobacter sp. JC074 TaxID=2530199 RepID=UPI001F10CA0B|nr:type II toxin-antitoxin system RnlB family antitoxin [Acidaminobacter sp. JC074]MCH4889807.1 hypothetical protein [Acidaminobacter sp. JC074]
MNNFDVVIKDNFVIIYSTSYVNPLNFTEDIEQELMALKFAGKVIFDLLLTVGREYNRYIEWEFDGKVFVGSTRILELLKKDNIRKESTIHFKRNLLNYDFGILPKSTLSIIDREITI